MQNLDRFSTQAREVLRQAQSEAARLHHAEVTPEHIAIVLSSNQRAMSLAIFRELNVAIPRLQNKLREAIGRGRLSTQMVANFSPRFQRAVDMAVSEAKVFGDQEIGTQHLLLGVIREGGEAKTILAEYGVSLYGVHKLMRGLGVHDGDQLPAVDLNQTPIMKSAVGRAVRALPVKLSREFMIICAFTAVAGFIAWLNLPVPQIPVLMFVIGGWVISLCLHEFGHAAVAYLGGDTTVVNKGYLTLNPLKYVNLLLSIIVPVIFLLIGGIPLPGGAVYIQRELISERRMRSVMSAAGPAGNLIFVALLLIPYHLIGSWDSAIHTNFWAGYAALMHINIFVVFINLIPIPGLDGYGIIEPFLPFNIQEFGNRVRPYAFLVLFIILWTRNPISIGVHLATTALASLVGIDFMLVGIGYSLFRIFN